MVINAHCVVVPAGKLASRTWDSREWIPNGVKSAEERLQSRIIMFGATSVEVTGGVIETYLISK